jgi:hypothetical protein
MEDSALSWLRNNEVCVRQMMPAIMHIVIARDHTDLYCWGALRNPWMAHTIVAPKPIPRIVALVCVRNTAAKRRNINSGVAIRGWSLFLSIRQRAPINRMQKEENKFL